MDRRRLLYCILLVVLVAATQTVLVQPFLNSASDYTILPRYILKPGITALAAILAGALLHLIFVTQNRRMGLPVFLILGVPALFVTFYVYISFALPFLLTLLGFPSLWSFASIVSGVFLGMLVTNQLRKPAAAAQSDDLAKEVVNIQPQG